MIEDVPMTEKLGCRRDSLDNCILIKASVQAVSTTVSQYLELESQPDCKLSEYINANKKAWKEVERQRQVRKLKSKKSLPPVLWTIPFWRYVNYQWTILPLASSTNDLIAYTLAVLLNTDAITFHDSDHASFKEYKVFRKDRMIEHYLFGFECGALLENYWDINIEDLEFYPNLLNHEHHFKSTVRQITESEVREAVSSRKYDLHDRGFLDACLKFYSAYIPPLEETPYHYHGESGLDFEKWDSTVERMDILFIPSNWKYTDRRTPNYIM